MPTYISRSGNWTQVLTTSSPNVQVHLKPEQPEQTSEEPTPVKKLARRSTKQTKKGSANA